MKIFLVGDTFGLQHTLPPVLDNQQRKLIKKCGSNPKLFMRNYLLRGLIAPIVLLIIIAVLAITCSLSTVVCEFLTQHVSRYIAYILSTTGAISFFSVFDWLLPAICVVLIGLLITSIILYILRHSHTASFIMLAIVNVLLCFILLFQLSAGVVYNRTALHNGMDIAYAETNTITKAELYEAAEYFINAINTTNTELARDTSGKMYLRTTFDFTASSLHSMINNLDNTDYLFDTYYLPKRLATSNIMSALNISGITMPLTGEIGINYQTFDYTLPLTIAHEIAHSKGIMQENQATALAINVCLKGSAEFRYSAYSTIVLSLINRIYRLDGVDIYRQYYNKIDNAITYEWQMYSKYLEQFDGFLNDVGNFFNDMYLKLNGVSTGVASYSATDGYIIGLYRNLA